MNSIHFTKLVKALKGRSSKNVGIKPTKPMNFDGVQNQKDMDVWLVEMEDHLHVAKVGVATLALGL